LKLNALLPCLLQVNDALQIYQMRREIAILRKVSYDRNIVQFYGACTAEPTMLCMEYMEVRRSCGCKTYTKHHVVWLCAGKTTSVSLVCRQVPCSA